MRVATIVLAATMLAGTQAAVVPREATTTTTAVSESATETVTTTEAFTTTTTSGAIETTTETVESTATTTTAEATATETATAEVVLTSADCANSTVPHSTACVKKWFHAAGCLNRELPADSVDAWVNNEDMAAIESNMAELYANATATDDAEDQAAFKACAPLPKPVMQVFDCVDNVITDTCATCFTPKKFFGVTLPTVNGTCLGECIHNEADKLAEFCPNLNQAVTCHDTLKKTCGKCSEKKGNILGMHVLDSDDDCFERCYWKNKDEIRSACPLPEPLKKAVDCHKTLAEECDECVDDDHEVDVKCLDGCFTEKSAKNETLKEICPERMTAGLATLAEMMPTDDDMEYFFEQLLSNVELPFNLDIESIFDSVISKLPKPDGHHGHGHDHDDDDDEDDKDHDDEHDKDHDDDEHDHDHDHDHDDDDDDDDDHRENGLAQLVQQVLNGTAQGNGELENTIDNILNQVFGDITSTLHGDDDHDDDSDDDDDDELTVEDENPLLSFLESFVSKILNFEKEVAASAAATATATETATETSSVEATTTTTETATGTTEATTTESVTETATSTDTVEPTTTEATTTESD